MEALNKKTASDDTVKDKPRHTRAPVLRAVVLALVCLLFVFAVITAILCLNGCGGGGKPKPTEAPKPADQAAYEMTRLIRYWPENADYTTCDYAVIVDQPVFARTQTAGAAMNEAVDAYLEDLYSRVENEYMAQSVAKPPYTEVACSVECYEEYTNVIFTEEHCYEAQPYKTTHVLILNARGEEVNANDIYRTYHADEYIADALVEMIRGTDHCYNDVIRMDVLAKLDTAHGCVVDANGCTVFLPEGVFAPYEYGELSFTVPAERIAPEFVGEKLAYSDYYAAGSLIDAVGSASIVRGANIENGELSPYAATAFMGAVMRGAGYAFDKGRYNVPAAEFEDFYRRCFGHTFPGIDTDGFDIRLEEGAYSISSTQKVYEYHVDMSGAEWQGDVLVITGDLVYGGFGYPYSTPVNHVEARLERSPESPYGFKLIDFIMSL